MTLSDFFIYIKDNPKFAALIILIFLLCTYNEHVKEQLKHPEKKDKQRIPPLSVASADEAIGIVFGKKGNKVYYSKAEKEGHVFVCAASGAGKTTSIAIPSIQSFCKKKVKKKHFWGFNRDPISNTCFVVDISGDIEPNCDIPNKLTWDVEDPNSIPYNILASIDAEKNVKKQNALLHKLAFIIMPDCAPKGSTTSWFDNSGRNILTGALILYYHQGMDFVEICCKIKDLSVFELFQEITDSGDKNAIRYISQFDGVNEKNTAGCKQSMDDAIMLFASEPNMAQIIRRPKSDELALTPVMLEKHSLFLKIPDADADTYGPLLGIITAQTFDYCARRKNYKKPHILFILDEYASLRIGKTAILNAVRKYRKKNIRLMILTQALTDIDILYDPDTRESILGNIKFKVILGITDPKSQKYFADIIGQREYRSKSTTINHNSTSVSYSVYRDYRVPPEKFGQLNKELYVIGDDASYIKLEKNYFFK